MDEPALLLLARASWSAGRGVLDVPLLYIPTKGASAGPWLPARHSLLNDCARIHPLSDITHGEYLAVARQWILVVDAHFTPSNIPGSTSHQP
jgi:hypothetical protein